MRERSKSTKAILRKSISFRKLRSPIATVPSTSQYYASKSAEKSLFLSIKVNMPDHIGPTEEGQIVLYLTS